MEKAKSEPPEPVIVPIDYKFMDGLRGFGAFAVYINHFVLLFYPWYSPKDLDNNKEKYYPPDWMRDTPVRVFYAGQLWVSIFFILSGFVLPLNFFRTGRQSAILGGTFRRYLRLMIPVLVIITLVYFFQRLDAYGDKAMKRTIDKNWMDAFLDGFLGTWFGNDMHNDSWLSPTWSLNIELWATFYVYLLS
jgi:peptidoglycan/LPS O-acetylase OafA/YrhL